MPVIQKNTISHRKPPRNLSSGDQVLFSREYEKKINATTLLQLKNVYVINDSIFDPLRCKFYTSFTHVHPVRKRQFLRNLIKLTGRKRKIKLAIWISDENAYGYFHWFTDCLTRLLACEDFRQQHVVLLPARLEEIPFVRESLKYFHITYEFCRPDEALKLGRLLLPSHTAEWGNYNPVLINGLRKVFSGNESALAKRMIYISRAAAEKRKVINEDEVVTLLEKFGIETHRFENYTLDQQIKLMKETKLLIGLHGAGLTNMLFMPAGSSVLELRNAGDGYNNCYFSLASDLDLPYYYLLNQGDSSDTHSVNIHVDLTALAKTISEITAQV